MSINKYEDMTVILIPTEQTLKDMGIYEKVLACDSVGSQYSLIQGTVDNIITEYSKLRSMGLIREDGKVDVDKITSSSVPVQEENSDNILQYIKNFSKNFAEVIVARADSETNNYMTRKNSFGITEYIYDGNVFENSDTFYQQAFFDFQKGLSELPLKPLTEKELVFIDPKGKIIKPDDSLLLVFADVSRAVTPELKLKIVSSAGKERTYPLDYNAACSILDSFKYEICVHEKGQEIYYAIAVSNNCKEAYNMAELAFAAESGKPDADKTASCKLNIEEVVILDKDNDCKIASVDKKGFHHIKPQSKEGNLGFVKYAGKDYT